MIYFLKFFLKFYFSKEDRILCGPLDRLFTTYWPLSCLEFETPELKPLVERIMFCLGVNAAIKELSKFKAKHSQLSYYNIRVPISNVWVKNIDLAS